MTDAIIDQEIINYLLASPPIQGLVDDRISPAPLTQGHETWPAITVVDVSDMGDMTGPEGVTGWRVTRVQVNSIHPAKYMASQLDSLVRQALAGFKGQMGGVKIGSSARLNSFSRYESDVKLFMVISDFRITVTTSQ